MALHLVQFLLPDDQLVRLDEFLAEHSVVDRWWIAGAEEQRSLVQVLVERAAVEALLDAIQSTFGHLRKFRLITSPVNLTLPEVKQVEPSATEEKPDRTYGWNRLSRQELLSTVRSATRLDRSYITMVILSVIVAASGMMLDNVAVVIAAMVIAPLLGPNIALALATTTGDGELLRRAVTVNLAGVSIAFFMALGLSLFVALPDPLPGEIADRVRQHWTAMPLALAAGAAGALSFTSGVSGSLVGVMVAVALLPPLLAFGLMTGHGQWNHAVRSLELLATNVVCVNVAGVVTFLLQGVRPARWWEAERAKRTTRLALAIWLILLAAILSLLIVFRQR